MQFDTPMRFGTPMEFGPRTRRDAQSVEIVLAVLLGVVAFVGADIASRIVGFDDLGARISGLILAAGVVALSMARFRRGV